MGFVVIEAANQYFNFGTFNLKHLPVLELILLFSELSLHLLELHGVLLNRLRLLIDLLLQGARHLHHVLVVLGDPISRPIDIFL